MKKRFVLVLTLILVCMAIAGCGGQTEETEPAWNGPGLDKTAEGFWGEKFQTDRGYTYPLELYSPLYECYAFNMKYELVEVTGGTIYDTTKFKIFVRTVQGDWIGVKLFTLDENRQAFVNVILDYPMDIEAVAVMCQGSGVEFSHHFTILDPG